MGEETEWVSEYKTLLPNDDPETRREYWELAKGLQKADGLSTSEYLETIIADTINGDYDTAEAVARVGKYYDELPEGASERESEEADKVSARITEYLEKEGFKFAPVQLKLIHRDLFQDMPEFSPGQYRRKNIYKNEDVLHGDTVRYANWEDIEELLAYDFNEESKSVYALPFTSAQVKTLARLVSGVWETHPFYEGNTRTVSTFLITYLKSLGVEINNDPFKEQTLWFRNALVRANYNNVAEGIRSEPRYLELFLENTLMNTTHNLQSIDLTAKSRQGRRSL